MDKLRIYGIVFRLPIVFLTIASILGENKIMVAALIIFIIGKVNGYNEYIQAKTLQKNECCEVWNCKKLTYMFFGGFVGSLILSNYISNSMHGTGEVLKYCERFLPFIFIMFFSRFDSNNYQSVWIGCVISNIMLCLTGWWQFFTSSNFIYVSGMLGNHNSFGGTLIGILPFLFLPLLNVDGIKKSAYNKLIAVCSVLVNVLTIILAQSRGALIGAALILLVGSIMFAWALKNNILIKKKLIIGCTFLLVLVTFIPMYIPKGMVRNYDKERLLLWKSGIAIFCEYPIAGTGTKNFNKVYIGERFISPLAKEPKLTTVHNIFLQFMVENGIIGFTGFIAMIGFQITVLIKNIKTKANVSFLICMLLMIIGSLAHGMVDTNFLNKNSMMMYWLFWGATCYFIKENYEKNISYDK